MNQASNSQLISSLLTFDFLRGAQKAARGRGLLLHFMGIVPLIWLGVQLVGWTTTYIAPRMPPRKGGPAYGFKNKQPMRW